MNITGEPAAGYEVGSPVIDPVSVEVTLPASDLGRVAKVQGKVELEGQNETFSEKRLKLFALDSKGNELEDAVIEPSTVAVEVPVTLPSKNLAAGHQLHGQSAEFTGVVQGNA
ncbi:CdaR family protein [Paenibacillus rhizoplanae]